MWTFTSKQYQSFQFLNFYKFKSSIIQHFTDWLTQNLYKITRWQDTNKTLSNVLLYILIKENSLWFFWNIWKGIWKLEKKMILTWIGTIETQQTPSRDEIYYFESAGQSII